MHFGILSEIGVPFKSHKLVNNKTPFYLWPDRMSQTHRMKIATKTNPLLRSGFSFLIRLTNIQLQNALKSKDRFFACEIQMHN